MEISCWLKLTFIDIKTNGAMVLSTLIQKNSLLIVSKGSLLYIKMILQSFINLLRPPLKIFDRNSFVWVFLHLLHSFDNFYNCSTWVGIYQLWNLHIKYHQPYMKIMLSPQRNLLYIFEASCTAYKRLKN